MQLVFRYFTAAELEQPLDGELHVRWDRDARGGRAMAELVLDEGPQALPQGRGPIERIIVSASPTFDDLLAAELVQRKLAGEEIPGGCHAFARYAALAREGLRPGDVPLESSLEGTFLAILNAVAEDLSTPQASAQFLTDWRRFAQRLFAAAKDNVDPFREPFLAAGSEFARERAFLHSDLDVFDQDVARGESWTVRLPGGPPEAPGLLLRKPKSLLFKYWSRDPASTPDGQAFLFMAVDWGQGKWVFSTDPVQRLSLLSLVELLQAAEAVRDAPESWFKGDAYSNTLIAAPKGGSRLSDEQVLKIVREWCGARKLTAASDFAPRPRRRWLRAAALALATAAGCVLLAVWLLLPPAPDARGLEVAEESFRSPLGPRQGKDYALLIATDSYKHWSKLSNPIQDAKAIAQQLTDTYGFTVDLVCDPTRDAILGKLQDLTEKGRFGSEDQIFIFVAGHGDRKNKEGYLVASDSGDSETDPKRGTMIPHSQVRDLAEKIECGHVLVVLDVCFGGTFDFGIAAPPSRGGTYEKVSKEDFVARKMACQSALWITSGANKQVSDGEPGEHSPFARQVIESLAGKGGPDGIVTFHELLVAVQQSSTSDPRDGQLRQNQAGGDFLFITH